MSRTRKIERKLGPWGGYTLWGQALFLFAIWLLLSGKLDAFHIVAGVVAVGIVLWLERMLGPANIEMADRPLRTHVGRFVLYVPWLIWQMAVSSWQVARIVFSPAMPLNPVVARFTSSQPHTIARVVLGNSITLTPGTLTLHIDGNRFWVHSLSDESTRSLLDGTMQRKVARVFCRDLDEPVTDVEVVKGSVRL